MIPTIYSNRIGRPYDCSNLLGCYMADGAGLVCPVLFSGLGTIACLYIMQHHCTPISALAKVLPAYQNPMSSRNFLAQTLATQDVASSQQAKPPFDSSRLACIKANMICQERHGRRLKYCMKTFCLKKKWLNSQSALLCFL